MKGTKYIIATLASFLTMGAMGLVWHYLLMKKLDIGFVAALEGGSELFSSFWMWYVFYLIIVLLISLVMAYYYRVFYNFGSPMTAGVSFGFFTGLMGCLMFVPVLVTSSSVSFVALEVLGVMIQFLVSGVLIGIIWGTDSSN